MTEVERKMKENRNDKRLREVNLRLASNDFTAKPATTTMPLIYGTPLIEPRSGKKP